ncbi:hypothetical protein [Streptomyces smyrnaeus]|uniref:hypothetical protein n=1 Tax=Streptomyces smyrnaeus TaxID=1387713 RepID=UPI0036BA7149
MRRCVTPIRACVSAFVLLLAVLLAVDSAGIPPAPSGAPATAATAENLSPRVVGEIEHGNDSCHPRRTVRHQINPPAPGERPLHADCRQACPPTAERCAPLPRNGSAGMPWRRSVGIPVLHQVLRH